MEINLTKLFSSKVGRRSFLLLLISSLVPLVLISIISLHLVKNQLLEQSYRSFHRETKSFGMEIITKIQQLDNEISLLDLNFPPNNNIINKLGRNLKNISFSNVTNTPDYVNNYLKRLNITFESLSKYNNNHIYIYEIWDQSYLPHLLAIKLIQFNNDTKYLFFGEIKESFIWNFDGIRNDETICVLNQENKILYCSKKIGKEMIDSKKFIKNFKNTKAFEWKKNNKAYLGSSWNIFFSYISSNVTWSVIASKPKTLILKPISVFETIFLIIISLTFVLIILLNLKYVKNILAPLLILKKSAESIAKNDYSSDIDIRTNDEFEELSNSFKSMRDELDSKFREQKYIAELDGVVLQITRLDRMLENAMKIVQKAINVESISIMFIKDNLYHNNIFEKDDMKSKVLKTNIHLTLQEINFYKSHNKAFTVHLEHSHSKFMQHKFSKGFHKAQVFPIQIYDEITSLVILSYKENLTSNLEISSKLANWVKKLSVIISKIYWINQINYQAKHDVLTRLPNRNSLNRELTDEINFCENHKLHIGIIFIDLDRFKYINDSLGHVVGDQFLIKITERLLNSINENIHIYRFGGDEFVITMSRVNGLLEVKNKLLQLSNTIIELISAPVYINGLELFSTSSLGGVLFPTHGKSFNELIKKSDIAMYQAKKLGGNNYQIYDESMQQNLTNRLNIETQLRNAIKDGEITPYFQPQYNCDTMEIIGAEALVRWETSKDGIIFPNDFIPIAEESTLICEIDLLVLEKTLSCIKNWRNKKLNFGRIAVNFSSRLIQQENIVSNVNNLLSQFQVTPQDIIIEITESAFIENFELTIRNMSALFKLGVNFAIDDFGTGYSSLTYLKVMPIYKLKIDRAFIKNMVSSTKDQAIVKNTISLCKELKIVTLAEGVENSEDLDMLKAMKCDEFQGYLKSKPVPIEQFEELLS